MRHLTRWALGALVLTVLAVLATGLARALTARQQQQQTALPAAHNDSAQIDISAEDLVQVQNQQLVLGVPLSGTLKASHSAMLKARIPGQLQGLTLRTGDPVRAGQLVANIDAREYQARLRQAQELADASQAQAEIAQRHVDNNQALVGQGFISQTALDSSQANLSAAQATYRANQAAVDISRQALADTSLYSPIDGHVAQRLAQPGERIGVEGRVLEVVDLRHMEMEAVLAASDALSVRVGQRASLQIEGQPERIQAQIVRISPSTQTGSRSILAYLALANPGGLRSGMFAQGRIDTGAQQVLAVPLDAVRTDKPAPYLQVLEQGRLQHMPVTLGVRGEVDGQTMVAISGLAEQVWVLRGHVGSLRAGTRVQQTAATATATAAASAP